VDRSKGEVKVNKIIRGVLLFILIGAISVAVFLPSLSLCWALKEEVDKLESRIVELEDALARHTLAHHSRVVEVDARLDDHESRIWDDIYVRLDVLEAWTGSPKNWTIDSVFEDYIEPGNE
jgi:hypothetical protein